jgi:hypothetical protein
MLAGGPLLVGLACASALHAPPAPTRGQTERFPTGGGGSLGIYSKLGAIDRQHPFFKSLGSTGVTCEHCHFLEDGLGLSAVHVRTLFDASDGKHPLFRPEAANNPKAAAALAPDAPADQRRALYSLLLKRGDVLVRLPLRLPNDPPEGADFTLVGVVDPSIPELPKVHVPRVGDVQDPQAYLAYTGGELWLHRRPLPAVSASFLSSVMWDGRGTPNPDPSVVSTRAGLLAGVREQLQTREAPAAGQWSPRKSELLVEQLTAFSYDLYAAQSEDANAGPLDADKARGGPAYLSVQDFYFGINDPFGDSPAPLEFSPQVFAMYSLWPLGKKAPAGRAAVQRGEILFNTKPLLISGVGGLNDVEVALQNGKMAVHEPAEIRGTCSTCHDAPGIGTHSTRLTFNIGVSDAEPVFVGRQAVADLPVFYLRDNDTGETARTTDPGRALVTGKWAQIGQFKGPSIRGLLPRAPYFHNGMAATLDDVVDFYNERFQANFSAEEKADLVAFLRTL